MNILGIYPSERRYARPRLVNTNPSNPADTTVRHEYVPDVVTIDVAGPDIDQVLQLLNAHSQAHRDPRVREAWERYLIMLQLTGPHR